MNAVLLHYPYIGDKSQVDAYYGPPTGHSRLLLFRTTFVGVVAFPLSVVVHGVIVVASPSPIDVRVSPHHQPNLHVYEDRTQAEA